MAHVAATSLLVSASFRFSFCSVCMLGCLLFPSGALVVAVFGWFSFFLFVVIIVCQCFCSGVLFCSGVRLAVYL